MSEIPESVALEAKKIVDAMPARTPWKHEVEDAIALSILAERDRCARIAESEKYNTDVQLSLPPQSAAAYAIYQAIRMR